MATVTRNRPKAVSVSKTAIDQVGSLLQDLSAKPKEGMSLREAIDQLREPIQSAMAKGYNYEDIIAVLAESGIPTTAATVKRYVSLSDPRKRKTPAKRGRRTDAAEVPARRSKADEPDAPPAPRGRRKAAEVAVEPEPVTRGRRKSTAEPAPKTSTRGRKKMV
jgi:hypothetical protein